MAKTPSVFESAFNVYTVAKVIGEGGSGRVFSVRDTNEEEFALKCLFPDKVTGDRRKRFQNEIGFCSNPRHANIIQVLDSGFAEWNKQKCPFYVMLRYPFTLRNLIDEKLAPADVLPLFSQILDAVEAAHLLGVFHRDLKPENIVCDSTKKHLVVADFGIAHFEEEMLVTSVETQHGSRMANFCYSAPEQRTKTIPVDQRADIFALGLILNEMFTNSVPQGEGYKTIEVVAPEYLYLDPLVEDMIQHDPNKRLSIKEFKKDLIGRRNAFIAQQELDKKRREVIRAFAPPEFEPIQLTAPKDFRDGTLTIGLNREPEPGWIGSFRNVRGISYLSGLDPNQFTFPGADIAIRVNERHAQDAVNHAKNFVEAANRAYQQQLKSEAKQREQQQREKLERETAEAETRARLIRDLKIKN